MEDRCPSNAAQFGREPERKPDKIFSGVAHQPVLRIAVRADEERAGRQQKHPIIPGGVVRQNEPLELGREIYTPPKAWAEAAWPNLFYWNELDRGGHFAAVEQPGLLVEEMRKAFRSRRT